MTNTICPRLLVETIDDVTVIGFADPAIDSEEAILEIFEHISDLAQGSGSRKLLRSRSRQRCNILYSMRGVRHRADPLTGVLSPIRWDVE